MYLTESAFNSWLENKERPVNNDLGVSDIPKLKIKVEFRGQKTIEITTV